MKPAEFHWVQIATPNHPIPSVDAEGKLVRINEMFILTENSPLVTRGRFWRHCPCPSLMPAFLKALKMQEQKNKLLGIVGPRGSGKTSAMVAACRVQFREENAAIKVDCAGMDLAELVWRTVITDGNQGLLDALNQKILRGEVNPLSLRILEDTCKKYIVRNEKGRPIELNFQAIRESASPEEVEALTPAINTVLMYEGLTKEKNSVGLSTVYGQLLECIEKDFALIVDEGLSGENGEALHEIMRQIAGQNQDGNLTLTQKGMKFDIPYPDPSRRFRLIITGNRAADGNTAARHSVAFYDRLQPIIAPNATADDIAHYACMELTGLPLSTIRGLYGKMPPTKQLLAMRVMGLTPAEKNAIPAEQIQLLNNADAIAQGALQIGHYMVACQKVLEDPSVMMQFTADEADMMQFGVRQTINIIKTALESHLPTGEPVEFERQYTSDISFYTLDNNFCAEIPPNNPLDKLGENVSRLIREHAINIARSHPNALNRFFDNMVQHGIVEPDNIPTAKRNQAARTLASLWNQDQQQIEITQDALITQEIMCNRIKTLHPELKNTPNEKIVSALEIQSCINALNSQLEGATNYIVVPNLEYIRDREEKRPPVHVFEMFDPLDTEELAAITDNDKLCDIEEFAMALASPAFIEHIKNTNATEQNELMMPKSYSVHQLVCRQKGQPVTVQLLIKNATNEVHLIAPEKIESKFPPETNITCHTANGDPDAIFTRLKNKLVGPEDRLDIEIAYSIRAQFPRVVQASQTANEILAEAIKRHRKGHRPVK
jgi:energy-coupling factor transporter ATP-binding protein EcfA2